MHFFLLPPCAVVATTVVFKREKRVLLCTSTWFQHLLKITYNIPNIGKKALRQGSRQFLLCRYRHLELPQRSLASLEQLWLGGGLECACPFPCACTRPSKSKA